MIYENTVILSEAKNLKGKGEHIMKIKNVRIFNGDGEFVKGDIGVVDGRFVSFDKADGEVLDGSNAMLVPGLIDIHLHGCHKDDFSDGTKEALETMLKYEISVGVTSICPTSMTIEESLLEKAMKVAGDYVNDDNSDMATMQGVNMEGPFINPAKKGAQDATYIQHCDVEVFRKLQKAAKGKIKIVDIAPEMENGLGFVDEVHNECVISIAHTNADYDTACEAYEKGASHLTHIYNAMPPFSHRAPGPIGAALDNDHVHIEMICDGIHIHPSVVRATFEIFGGDRVIMISDSMRATGLGEGISSLGGQEVLVVGHKATLTSDGAIAGSVTNLMECVRVAVKEMDIPLEVALRSATYNPAREIGIDEDYGTIEEGKYADFILLNDNLDLLDVYKRGRKVKSVF